MGIGTFGSFTQARLAIYAAQTGITVTGNNISNINTTGYTRQRLDQGSLYTAGSDRYYSQGDVRIGQGVLVRGLSQIRSPYLDIRFRTESAKVGYSDGMLDGLQQIASILDEVGKGDADRDEEDFGVLGLEFSEIYKALSELTEQTGHQEYDSTVKQACKSLATLFNRYANNLQEVYDNTVTKLHEDVDKVNSLLTTIRNYNEEIRKCDIHGDNALELRDERNVAIDELSQLIGIRVHYSTEKFSAGVEIEKLSIYLDNKNPDGAVETDSSLLIDGVFGSQLILEQVPQPRDEAALKEARAKDPDKKDATLWPYEDADNPGCFTDSPKAADGSDNTVNPLFEQYLTPEGKPTADPAEARQVDSPNFNITVSELRNKAGRLLYFNSVGAEEQVTDAAEILKAAEALKKDGSTTEQQANGDIIITKYREVLKQNPPYLDDKGQPTMVNTGIPNPSYFKYVKPQDPDNPNGPKTYSNTKLPGMTENPINPKGQYLNGTTPCDAADADRTYYKTVITQVASKPVELDDNDLYGEVQAMRELLTEGGQFTNRDVITTDSGTGPYRNTDEDAGTKHGIVYYQRRLDLLANQFATILNEANQGFRTDPEGNYITYGTNDQGKTVGVPVTITGTDLNNNPTADTLTLGKNTSLKDQPATIVRTLQDATGIIYDPAADNSKELIDAYLKLEKKDENGKPVLGEDGKPQTNGIFDGGVLFSNNGSGNDTEGITASNISVSYLWQNTESLLVRSFICPPGDTEPASGHPDNIRHLMYLVDGDKHDFVPSDLDATGATENASSEIMFHGTFFEYWNNIGSDLGEDQKMTGKLLDTAYQEALSVDTSRDSVSAVDFNDEAMNLMMYAKSYNAACRLMTTIDSVLDKLVNNTGVTT